MDSRAREVIRIGKGLFDQKQIIDTLNQEIALNFYPDRADFTEKRTMGEEFSDHLFTSYPVLAHRELSNLLAANLRDQSRQWVNIHVQNERIDQGRQERAFLEYLTKIHWRGLYDPKAHMIKATKQCDFDFAAFGNGVIYGTPNMDNDGPLYRNYHLRDCAWSENAAGEVDHLHRKWKPTARQLVATFGDNVHASVKKCLKKEPEKTIECQHVVMPARLYEKKNRKGDDFAFVSLWVDTAHEHTMEEIGLSYFPYCVPRWHLVSGSQYGRSLATSIILPDGRTMQVITRTLREAGEKFVDPPMITIADAIRGDVATYAGGITVADMEYDERLGEVLRPLTQDRGGMPIGFEMANALKEDISSGFLLDKIQLPMPAKEQTAFEIRRRMEEHIRSSAPIFEPIQQDYNVQLNQLNFNILAEGGAFPFDEMPESLQGQDIEYKFHSPLSELAEQAKAQVYGDVLQRILMPAAQIDPAQLKNLDLTTATRESMKALGTPAEWMGEEDAVAQEHERLMQLQQMQMQMQAVQQGAQIAETGANAEKALSEANREG
jgi:hypothetical protein